MKNVKTNSRFRKSLQAFTLALVILVGGCGTGSAPSKPEATSIGLVGTDVVGIWKSDTTTLQFDADGRFAGQGVPAWWFGNNFTASNGGANYPAFGRWKIQSSSVQEGASYGKLDLTFDSVGESRSYGSTQLIAARVSSETVLRMYRGDPDAGQADELRRCVDGCEGLGLDPLPWGQRVTLTTPEVVGAWQDSASESILSFRADGTFDVTAANFLFPETALLASPSGGQPVKIAADGKWTLEPSRYGSSPDQAIVQLMFRTIAGVKRLTGLQMEMYRGDTDRVVLVVASGDPKISQAHVYQRKNG